MMRLPHLAFFCVCVLFGSALSLHAQPRNRVSPVLQQPDQLNEAEGREVLATFRQVGWPADFALRFRLIHYPRQGGTEVHTGTLYGAWDPTLPLTRVEFDPADGHREAYLWRGTEASWAFGLPPTPDTVQQLGAERLHEPLLPGLVYTPFDFQIPFLEWTDYVYEGTERVSGRPAHYYLLYPPADDARYAEVGGVRLMIDAGYYAILRAEVLDPDGKVIRTLRVGSFKKVDGQWIVTRFDLTDEKTRSRTRLEFDRAALNQHLPADLFTPETLGEGVTAVPPSAFKGI